MTNKEKSKKLHKIADALEEWSKYNENVSNVAEWSAPAAKQIIRKAMTLLVDNLALLNECRSKYGCYSSLHQCFLEIEQAASFPKTNDLGNCRAWVSDFTERHLWGGEKRSFADECVRYANELNRETEQRSETIKEKQEGTLEPKPPEFLQNLLWILKNWKKNLAILILAGLILLGVFVWPKIDLFGGFYHSTKKEISKEAKKEALDDYGRTALYARTQKRIDDLYKNIENEKLNPWLFINAGVKIQITEYNGKIISYEGVTFEGSPRLIFWSDDFIPPFIEDAIIKVFDQTIDECRKNNLAPKPYIDEANSLLNGFIGKIYYRMAEIDHGLRGKGHPKDEPRKDVSYEIEKMRKRLKGQYDAAVLLASKNGSTD